MNMTVTMYACMYVCLYVCMHACMHACMYANVRTYVRMHACMRICIYFFSMSCSNRRWTPHGDLTPRGHSKTLAGGRRGYLEAHTLQHVRRPLAARAPAGALAVMGRCAPCVQCLMYAECTAGKGATGHGEKREVSPERRKVKTRVGDQVQGVEGRRGAAMNAVLSAH